MGKRPSRSDDDDGDADDAKKREAECRGTLKALNAQFAAWVARRATESPIVSWGKGCEDYLKHVEKIKVRSLVRSLVFLERWLMFLNLRSGVLLPAPNRVARDHGETD